MSRMHRLAAAVLIALSAGSISSARAEGLNCEVLPTLFGFYLRLHYVHKSMSEEIRKNTVEQYVKNIDPSHTLLYTADVEKLKKELPTLFKTMDKGDCGKLDEVNALLVSRAQENEKIAREIITDKYKLDEAVELVTDPEKRKYPSSLEEKKALLTKIIHFQISNQLIAKTKLPEAKKSVLHGYELVVKRLKERKPGQQYNELSEAFALALDPHSSYLSADTLEEFRISMQLSLEGIGASLSSQDGFTVIEEIIPGGAADRSKRLQPKDKIIAVGQDGQKPKSVIDMDLSDVVRQIRGKKGTKVTLMILRQGEKTENLEVTILRDKIDIKESAAKITYENKKVGNRTFKIGMIDLPSFYGGGKEGRSSYQDMKKLVMEANKSKVDGLILDLSRNGGGLLDDAVRIASLFVKNGPVVATKGYDKKVDVLSDKDNEVLYSGPLMILTSRHSASASEILAGALKDYGRALIVGSDHTYGKGTVQVVTDLPQGMGAVKVSTGMFFIPGGQSTQHQGVESQIELPSIYATDDVGEKTMDYSLPPEKIPTFLGNDANTDDVGQRWKALSSVELEKLKKLSADRVAKDEKFAEVRKNLEEIKKNKGVIRLAEMRKKAEDERKQDEKKGKNASQRKKLKDKIKDSQAPLIGEGMNIMTDWLTMTSMVVAPNAKPSPASSLGKAME